ncbi:hypothetical protein BN946_scf184884.g59 [Trametes cinnabarina]|uniref:Uncharacterized protein n=1 Tax=Pycnoporus cinnabarinus TaxID=5643 RepID=A0A060S6C4_PYCCI|nr:hypothetical protein BN946_scf184884.g59 [Trametes cinnabarina]
MSSTLNIFGFFALAGGVRRSTPRASSSSSASVTFHCYYSTVIQCSSGSALPAELRVYSPPGQNPLPNNTIVFLTAKLHLRSALPVLMDAMHLYPFPGDVNDMDYEDHVPDMPYPLIYGIGTVQSKEETLADGKSRGFLVSASERVRDVQALSTLQCVFDNTPRWVNVPCPSFNSLIYFFGSALSIRDDGLLSISLTSLQYNLTGSQPSQPSQSETPIKRRKFNAFASP